MFRNQFSQSKVVALEKNRRSTTPILQCAFALIDKNPAIHATENNDAAENGGRRFRLHHCFRLHGSPDSYRSAQTHTAGSGWSNGGSFPAQRPLTVKIGYETF